MGYKGGTMQYLIGVLLLLIGLDQFSKFMDTCPNCKKGRMVNEYGYRRCEKCGFYL